MCGTHREANLGNLEEQLTTPADVILDVNGYFAAGPAVTPAAGADVYYTS
jgi:hypothetical protein